MSTVPDTSASAPSFLERFLEERSIKWMLGLGMLVLLGSSLKFVTHHWETYSPFWKYLVLIAYTAVTYGLAEIGLHRLMLKRTGTGLQALTLSLLPLTFLALRWVAPGMPVDLASLAHEAGLAMLVLVNFAFTAFASRRILRTLLQSVPVTYWLAYLVLCVSGALAPAVPPALAPVAAVVLWVVFTTGVVKVNRHVFWLAEEQRWPRIFAFFPTVLLAAQFLTVFALNFAPAISTPWWGFGLVLVALPTLLTADAAAKVFQQRSGQIVFPWPTEIIAPLVLGLAGSLAGMGLALSGLPRPMALVPTAAFSAVCFGAVARRTGRSAFAWAMLLCLLTAYQFSPVYFVELARQVVQTSAEMVGERRLPFAFYGITYAPFILGLALAGRGLKSPVFATPCLQLSLLLATLTLLFSWTDPKAVFIAGSVLSAVWLVLRFVHADARCDWGAGLAWLSAAWGVEVFLREICFWRLPEDFGFWSMPIAAGVLAGISRIAAFRKRAAVTPDALEFLSTATLSLFMAGCMARYATTISTAGTGSLALILPLLALHHRRRAYPVLGEVLLLVAGGAAVRYGLAVGMDTTTLGLASVIVLVTGWAVALAIKPLTSSLTVRAFRLPLQRVTTGCLVGSQFVVIVGLITAVYGPLPLSFSLTAGLVTVWSLMAAGRTLPVGWVHVGCTSVLVIVGRGLFSLCDAATAWMWLLVAWGATVLLGGSIARRITPLVTDEESVLVATHVDRFAFVVEWLLAMGTLGWLSWPSRLAGGLVIVNLAMRVRSQKRPSWKHALFELSFLQLLVGLLSCATSATFLGAVSNQTWLDVQIPGTFFVAVWLLLVRATWFRRFVGEPESLDLTTNLWELAVAFSTLSLVVTQAAPLTLIETAGLVGLFGVLCAERFRLAIRQQSVESVWTGLAMSAAGVGLLAWFQVFPLHHVVTLGTGLAVAWTLSAIAGRCRESKVYGVLAEPFDRVGFWLPAAVAAFSVGGSILDVPTAMVGTHSLVILAAAACYFVRWIETRHSLSLLMATAIFNVSQMLLWHELSWTDPQLFLMPLGLSLIALAEGLPRELQAEVKVTLRYAGALVILVSPLFNILGGDWLPLLTLMAASLGVSVLSLGLKSRPLLYSGTAFLVADLIALVVRGSLERTDVLWIVGIALGSSVIALAAYCENHREVVLQRMRMLSATLQTWS